MALSVAAKASLVAILGWGVGLTLVGVGLIIAAIFAFLNLGNLTFRYFRSIVTAGSLLPFLGERYRTMRFNSAKNSIGAALLLGGAIFTSLGIYALTAL